jgi:hypothetical protein
MRGEVHTECWWGKFEGKRQEDNIKIYLKKIEHGGKGR